MSNKKPVVPNGDYVLIRPNRRKELRADLIVLDVRGEDEKGFFFGYAKNLSKAGMFISSVNPRKIGDKFSISFKLPFDEEVSVKCECRVVWAREYDPKSKESPGMGIKFLDLDYKIKKRIGEWIQSIDIEAKGKKKD
ncbi:MAG: pilus assembly protein PilZ [Desulfobacterales bacterium]|nr:pilus assembly protein PilZ [Desulfobacterales bacterium]